MTSQVHQNYHQECEASINRQINMELYASYVYLSMFAYFDRDDVTLNNFAKFFQDLSHKEWEHVEKLIKFQSQRGGHVILQDVVKPDRDDWSNGLEALQCALHMEKVVNQSLVDIHKLASDMTDPHMCDFLETQSLDEQIKAIIKLGDMITNLTRIGAPQSGMAEYLFDKLTLGESSENTKPQGN
ncbi:ferritin heavy chain-like [Leucoraja erinacea]|uniref:ferritin heavy chain-like n=1 Tax=Leucoraja erinaceus TaxID=7782 RepID=UPI002455ADEE|nr:ferritin heavy chain-like [Leucoraja erinacea]